MTTPVPPLPDMPADGEPIELTPERRESLIDYPSAFPS